MAQGQKPLWLVLEEKVEYLKDQIHNYMEKDLCVPTELNAAYNKAQEDLKNLQAEEKAEQAEAKFKAENTKPKEALTLGKYNTAKVFFLSDAKLQGGGKVNVLKHNLNLRHKDAFTLSFKRYGMDVMIDYRSIDNDSCGLCCNANITGSITIMGL